MKITGVIGDRIAKLFQKRGEVDPPMLIKSLEREVVKQKKQSDGVNVVPNDYTIYLCEEDCHRLSAARVIKALYESVEKKVIRENCFMDGILSVRIEKLDENEDLIVVESKFIDDKKLEEDTINLDNDVLSQTLIRDDDTNNDSTIIADKTNITSTMRTALARNIEYDLAVIGDSRGNEIIVGERQVYFGRNDTNDFILNDEGASRIHAYISYERHRHVMRDAGSLNGTFVNKKPIIRCELRHGDKILIGNTTLTYRVL